VPPVFAATAHIFYGERVMDVDDDVPKVSIRRMRTRTPLTLTLTLRVQWEGHKNISRQLPHAPGDDADKTIGKGKRHKAQSVHD
jgi:hypothetical protein